MIKESCAEIAINLYKPASICLSLVQPGDFEGMRGSSHFQKDLVENFAGFGGLFLATG
jgi:hypothetical protein